MQPLGTVSIPCFPLFPVRSSFRIPRYSNAKVQQSLVLDFPGQTLRLRVGRLRQQQRALHFRGPRTHTEFALREADGFATDLHRKGAFVGAFGFEAALTPEMC